MQIKITELEAIVISRDVEVVGTYSPRDGGFGGKRDFLVITIRTDQGVEGHCMAGGHSSGGAKHAADSIVSFLRAELVGKNPLSREALWSRMWALRRRKSLSAPAIAAIDVALWDIAGKIAGLPVYQLMGAAREKVKTCASSMYLPDPAAYVQDVLRLKEGNHALVKLFPGGVLRRDIGICEAVRDAVGPDTELAIDSVFSYDRRDALKLGRALEELDFKWFEDPLVDTDVEGYVQLSRALDIPVAAGDTDYLTLETLPEYVLRGAVDIVRADVAFKGGITPVKKMADICDAFGLACELHHAGNAPMNLANLHVALSMKGETHFEVMKPASLHNYGMTGYMELDREGYIHAPTKPGLGFDMDWDRIKHDKVAQV
jgi:L-alanine-DL-glutamate epimerase-like enolase superfamily enzyme